MRIRTAAALSELSGNRGNRERTALGYAKGHRHQRLWHGRQAVRNGGQKLARLVEAHSYARPGMRNDIPLNGGSMGTPFPKRHDRIRAHVLRIEKPSHGCSKVERGLPVGVGLLARLA